jgi:hypothetical protein
MNNYRSTWIGLVSGRREVLRDIELVAKITTVCARVWIIATGSTNIDIIPRPILGPDDMCATIHSQSWRRLCVSDYLAVELYLVIPTATQTSYLKQMIHCIFIHYSARLVSSRSV